MSGKHDAGKGSRFRPVDQKKYDDNWERCFGKKKKNTQKGAMQKNGVYDMTDIPQQEKKED